MIEEIGTQKQFFIDWRSIRAGLLEFDAKKRDFAPRCMPRGVRIAAEKPAKSEAWLKADRPWEDSAVGGYVTVIHENGLYRLWYESYSADPSDRDLSDWTAKLCYAESHDGFAWLKPELGIAEHRGSKANNIVYDPNLAGKYAYHGGSVFHDPSCPPEEQYKLIYAGNVPGQYEFMIRGATSPDGVHWKPLPDPLIEDYLSDSQTTCYYDRESKCYVAYFRSFPRSGWGDWGRRAIARAATPDFRKWPRPETIFALDGPLCHPSHDLYTNAHVKYAQNTHFMFPAQYNREKDTVAIHLAVSRDGIRWHYFGDEPILTPFERRDDGSMYAGCGLVPLGENNIALPCAIYHNTHNVFLPAEPRPYAGEYHWAVWEKDRLVALEAPDFGECSICAFIHRQSRLLFNLRTSSAGEVRVQLGDENANPIPGYSFEDCDPLVGDHPETAITWRGNPDISPTAGKPVAVSLRLRSAKIYTFRVE